MHFEPMEGPMQTGLMEGPVLTAVPPLRAEDVPLIALRALRSSDWG